MPHVTIIGGGITGLAAAFYLQKKSREHGEAIDYTLIESEPRFGGKIVTAVTDDFVIEGGPDSFITQKPWGMQLCRDVGLADRLLPTNDDCRNIYVLNKGKLVPFPGGMRLTVPTEFVPFALSPLISPWGKLRMGLDLLIPPRQEQSDESVGSFIRRRLGDEAVDKFADSIMAGIYMADPDRLSIQSTFPMFVEMERKYGSLIKAMQIAKKKQATANKQANSQSMFTSLRGGMTELVEALVRQLDGDLRPGCRVVGLGYRSPGFELTLEPADGRPVATDAVILTTPAYTAAALLEPLDPQLATMLNQIRHVSSATISLGYHRHEILLQHHLDGFGFVIPRSERRPISACTWTSTKFGHRAAEDKALLRIFVGGDDQEHIVDLPDDDLVALVRSELVEIMGLTAEPITRRIFRWPKGRPQYDVGHLDRVAEIEKLAARFPGLYLAGSTFRGVGLPDCIKNALTTVDQILEHFQVKQPVTT